MVDVTEPGRAFEDEYRAARAALDEPDKGSHGLVLVISMIVFAVSMSTGSALRQIVITIGVLLVHEAGHYVGMRAFGYRDVRMFFIPFFGAAVAGKPRGVKAWKDGVVSLLGPLPGIALGFILTLVWHERVGIQHDAINTLLVINVLNLLPLGGFDGSRFLQRVLFARHRYLEIAFLTVAGISLLILAISQRMWVIAVFAYFGLVVVPLRHRILRAAHGLKDELSNARDARKLDDARGYSLYLAARDAAHPGNRSKPKVVSGLMDQILEATRPAPSALATIGLLTAWLAGFVLAVVAFIANMKPAAMIDYPVPGGGFVVSMPAGAKVTSVEPKDPSIRSIEEYNVESGKVAYGMHVEIMASSLPNEAHAAIVEPKLTQLASKMERPVESITQAGLEGRRVSWKETGDVHCRMTCLFDGARDITLVMCGPGAKAPIDDLLSSLRKSP